MYPYILDNRAPADRPSAPASSTARRCRLGPRLWWLLSLLVAGLAALRWGSPSAPWYLAGALAYLAGTFVVTGVGNVPLNDRLAVVPADEGEAVSLWEHYLERWTRLNTLRTVAAAAAALMWLFGLLRGGSV